MREKCVPWPKRCALSGKMQHLIFPQYICHTEGAGGDQTRSDCGTPHYLLGQDAAYAIWEQVRIPSLHDAWQPAQGDTL